MTKQDLRIGNLVNQTGSVQGIVTELRTKHARIKYELDGKEKYSLVDYGHLEPIRLNDHWLEVELGLTPLDPGYWQLSYDLGTGDEISIDTEGNIRTEDEDGNSIWITECYFVHELQNFFFSLQKKELEVKP